MRLPRALKQHWQQYPTLRAPLRATENLSHSPFGQTEDGLADFRGIRLYDCICRAAAETHTRIA